MILETFLWETRFSEFILYMYVVYRAGERHFVVRACRIEHLVCVAIPDPKIWGSAKKNPLWKVGRKAAQW